MTENLEERSENGEGKSKPFFREAERDYSADPSFSRCNWRQRITGQKPVYQSNYRKS